MPPFYVTTPIFYVNDVPHIGHAYTVIAADVVARYRRMRGDEVFFLTGTDEHGQKIEKAAAGRGETPQVMVDRLSGRFRAMWDRLDISYDDYIRTTEDRHKQSVTALYARLKAAGDIYEDAYEGAYCVPCESFWTDLQLVEGHCPDCARTVETVQESSYFFRLSRYGDDLLAHIQAHPGFITPAFRANEVSRFIEGGLKDLSISRTGVKWAIPVPDDAAHTIYVWLDALTNYLTATGYPADGFEKKWPAQVHIIGKDILRFHAIYWPSFLKSAGLPLPQRVATHGWWTIDGEKMSKSKGNVVDPGAVADHIGVDQLRYFLLREVPFGKDGDFSVQKLVARTNTDLANDLGNLLSRTVSMVHKNLAGVLPVATETDAELAACAAALPEKVDQAMAELAFDKALTAIWEAVGLTNRYIDRMAPWRLAKAGDMAGLGTVLYNALEMQRIVALLVYPVMPGAAARIWDQLGVTVDPLNIDLSRACGWGGLASGAKLPDNKALFPRIDIKTLPDSLTLATVKKETPVTTDTPTTPTPAAPATPASAPAAPKTQSEDEFISIHDFAKVRLQVGIVTEAEAIKKAKKLLKLQVDIGTEVRQIVAGIARHYTPEEMLGRRVVVVTNLRPAKLMGVESQGMLLAAGEEEVLALLAPNTEVSAGTRVK